MTILDGKKISAEIRAEIRAEVEASAAVGRRRPCLAAVLVGDNAASAKYVELKAKACAECGMLSRVVRLPGDTPQDDVVDAVRQLNADRGVDGFLVQLPLPEHIDERTVLEHIDPAKDVDGFTPANIGRLALGMDCLTPATPTGIRELLRRYGISTRGKRCVVVGRSNVVGRPMASLLLLKGDRGDATVTVCHSATTNLGELTREADILISAAGHPGLIKAGMVRPGAVVVDVGTTRVPDTARRSGYRLAGDVDFDAVAPLCSYITPMPGGVGPMTIASLLQNALRAYRNSMS